MNTHPIQPNYNSTPAPALQNNRTPIQQGQPIVARTPAKVSNSDKAKAASSTRVGKKPTNTVPNYVTMSDEEFAKVKPYGDRV